jgi:hypothetical protein
MFFLDDDLAKLGRAFDRAWDRFLRMGMLSPANLSRSQESLAKSILQKANLGERDEWRLAREAVAQLAQVESGLNSTRKRYPQPTYALHTQRRQNDGSLRS